MCKSVPQNLHSRNIVHVFTRRQCRRRHGVPAFSRPPSASLNNQSTSHSQHHLKADQYDRRAVLLQATAAILSTLSASALEPSPADAAAALVEPTSPQAPLPATYEPVQGKAGFKLQRPTNRGWVTAFVRPDSILLHPPTLRHDCINAATDIRVLKTSTLHYREAFGFGYWYSSTLTVC